MIHTKFQDHRTFGSGEDFFLRFWSCNLDHLYDLSFPLLLLRLHVIFRSDWPGGFDRMSRQTEGRTAKKTWVSLQLNSEPATQL